jgi:hypothetical protein
MSTGGNASMAAVQPVTPKIRQTLFGFFGPQAIAQTPFGQFGRRPGTPGRSAACTRDCSWKSLDRTPRSTPPTAHRATPCRIRHAPARPARARRWHDRSRSWLPLEVYRRHARPDAWPMQRARESGATALRPSSKDQTYPSSPKKFFSLAVAVLRRCSMSVAVVAYLPCRAAQVVASAQEEARELAGKVSLVTSFALSILRFHRWDFDA